MDELFYFPDDDPAHNRVLAWDPVSKSWTTALRENDAWMLMNRLAIIKEFWWTFEPSHPPDSSSCLQED